MRPLLDRPLRRALLAAALIHGAGAATAAASLPAALLAGIDLEEWVWRHYNRWHDDCFAYYDPACPPTAAGPVQLFVPPPITRVVRRADPDRAYGPPTRPDDHPLLHPAR